ncbi:MAG: hypothetical protein V4693_20000 [Pseudomonadota bacterium]
MRVLLLCLLLAASVCGAADVPLYDFRKPLRDGVILVGMECHTKNRTLEVALFDGNRPPDKRMDLWPTAELVRYDGETNMVSEILELERQCMLGDDRYVVRFRGLPGAANATWQCGAIVTASAKVWKNGRLLFDGVLDTCDGANKIRVRFRAGSDIAHIEHVDR